MMDAWPHIASASASVTVDPTVGMLRDLTFRSDGRVISPLHAAPWRDDSAVQADERIAPVERRLSGDFFCAPFAANDVESGPPHGWSANSSWETITASPGHLHLRLCRTVSGATLDKHLRLADDAPLLYQRHTLTGGTGGLPVAHHPMVRCQGRAQISTSAKRWAITPDTPLEPDGRSHLAYPHLAEDPRRFRSAAGDVVDLTVLPLASRHEDFVTLVEQAEHGLGWTAICREDENDVVFVLKNAAVLPVTMIWYSNGGRDYRPWNAAHIGVVGIEDGCAPGILGHRAARGPNPLRDLGVATCLMLEPGRVHSIPHVIGAIPLPQGWVRIADMHLADGGLVLTDISGRHVTLPFHHRFLEPA